MWFIKEKKVNHIDSLTTEEIEKKLLERYGNLYKNIISEKEEIDLFERLRNVDRLHLYLQALMNKDVLRYFTAQNDVMRDQTRGAFQRTLYLKNKLKAKKKLNKTDNKRYK